MHDPLWVPPAFSFPPPRDFFFYSSTDFCCAFFFVLSFSPLLQPRLPHKNPRSRILDLTSRRDRSEAFVDIGF
ncbi:hypothetical protein MRB53_015015 [Persea americana]|uniref:Uncharacterized protein n=1 Tax=Persea americana TaxID=3435 RepID=A0ACC2KCI3_PERAE|nr:hypothetical protein MRB53_015015 [Persea americana]